MSGATYRIEMEHYSDSDEPPFAWWAKIFKHPDAIYLNGIGGDTYDETLAKARMWVAAYSARELSTVYVDDEGRDAEHHSVRR